MSPRIRGLGLLVLAVALGGGLVLASLAQGGADRGTVHVANPCHPRPSIPGGGTSGELQRIALDGLDGAACHLRVSRERLVVALASDDGRRHLFGSGTAQDQRVEEAIRSGLRRAIDDAADRKEIGGFDLRALRLATDHLPIAELMRAYQAVS